MRFFFTVVLLFSVSSVSLYAQTNTKANLSSVGTNIILHSKILNEGREVQIYLPPEYHKSNQHFPVLYVLDAERYFLLAVSMQRTFLSFEQTPAFIVVGLSKTEKERNANFSSNADNFRGHIEKEVFPFMERQFRVNEQKIVFGWGYAGGFVLDSWLTTPSAFTGYIAASPFPLLDKTNKLDSVLNTAKDLSQRVYFSVGSEEGVVKSGAEAFYLRLCVSAPENLDWKFRLMEGEEHRSTPYSTMYHGLLQNFEYYKELQFSSLEAFNEVGGLNYAYAYYEVRAKRYGFSSELTNWTMFSITRNAIRANNFTQFDALVNEFEETGYLGAISLPRASTIASFYADHGKFERAIELYEFLNKTHPDSIEPLIALGNMHKSIKNNELAVKYYSMAKKMELKSKK